MSVSRARESYLNMRNTVALMILYLLVCVYVASNEYFEPISAWSVLGLSYGLTLLGLIIASLVVSYSYRQDSKLVAAILYFVVLAIISAGTALVICLNVGVTNEPDGQVIYSSPVLTLAIGGASLFMLSYFVSCVIHLTIYYYRHRND